jgi:hypothetical protein
MAWDRGKLSAKLTKETALLKEVKDGNIQAIQLHDKKEKDANIAEAKARIFGRA